MDKEITGQEERMAAFEIRLAEMELRLIKWFTATAIALATLAFVAGASFSYL